MPSHISLLGTIHRDCGETNHWALSRILEQIKPDSIFIECDTEEHFWENYNALERRGLFKYEASPLCITKPILIPVDLPSPDSNFSQNVERLVYDLPRTVSFKYHSLFQTMKQKTETEGFRFINSLEAEELREQEEKLIPEILSQLEHKEALKLHKEWNTLFDKRNHVFLDNIYSYCETHNVKNGLFMVGHAHKKPIKMLIEERNSNLIEWDFLDY